MATTPTLPQPQSYDAILGAMLATFASKTGIPSVSVGSASLSLLETVALAVSRSSGDVFQTILNASIDYATGNSLQAIAAEFGITPTIEQPATGFVNVTDSSFLKVSTSVYPGAAAVNQGSVIVYAGSNVGFPATGSIYVGRGTNDSEGPLPYTSIVPIGNYFQFNLSSPTQKFHNVNESIILSQGGNRIVGVNTVVIAPSNGLQPDTQYSVTQQGVILDGEVTVNNVPITALVPGANGNVSPSAISTFSSAPFNGAVVTNSLATSGGKDPETADQLRTQIKLVLSSIGLGTATAIKNSLIGASSTEESATIASDSLITNADGSSTVFINTGSSLPYEAKTAGVAIEHIIDSAIGGEDYFQLATGGTQAPVAKAFLQSTDASPFAVLGGYVLAVTVGGVTTQHTFLTSDFQAPGAATAYEICASINADFNLNYEATTAGSGAYVVIRAIAESNEEIQIATPDPSTLTDANNFLGFPTTLNETLRLYKNSTLLSEDGNTASVFSQPQGLWSNSIANGDTLIVSVDGTAPITYTILDTDFIATGLYTTVSPSNSLASWAEVFNNKITGVTATVVGTEIELSSNLGKNNRAQVTIGSGSTLVTKSMFGGSQALSSHGAAADYTLDRNTAQIQLATPLVAGDNLVAGSTNTKGTIESSSFAGSSVTLASEGYIWLSIDEPVTFIPSGASPGGLLSVTANTGAHTVSYTSSIANSFSNVNPGDYLIVWSLELDAPNRLEGRVHSISTTTLTNDTLTVLVTAAEAAAVVPQTNVLYKAGFVIVRTSYVPQKFNVPAGTLTLDAIAAYLQLQTDSLNFSVYAEQFLLIGTNTLNTDGSVTVVTFDNVGGQLGFTVAQTSTSSYPIIAHQDTASAYLPAFFHSKITSDTVAYPPDTSLTTFTSQISVAGREPDEIVTFLNPYGGIDDEQPDNEVVQETVIAGTSISITYDPDVRRLRTNDRYFLSNPLSFGNNDSLVAIIDNNPVNNTFQVPLYRRALTNTSYAVNSHNFNAYDKDYAPTGNFATSFGPNFVFNNYRVLMQAKKTLSSTTQQSSILYRSVPWGTTGQEIIVSYIFNGAASSITNSVTITNTVNITITVPPATTATAVAAYVTTNLPTYITATVVDDGSGGTPGAGIITANASAQLLDGMNWLLYSNLINNTTVVDGTTSTGSNILTDISPTNGIRPGAAVSGAGISGGTTVVSVNGPAVTISPAATGNNTQTTLTFVNTGSPQFVLKNPLSLPTDVGYAFNNGETIMFSPTTIDQVYQFVNVLPVSGITTTSLINTANRDSELEISSDTFGSGGYVDVVGGAANGYTFPVINGALNIDNTYAAISASIIPSGYVLSDQWFRLQATYTQQKDTLFGNNTDVTILPNTPSAGFSQISLSGINSTQRYFGQPRVISGLTGLTFRVENQGNLVCFSYVGSTSSPQFLTVPVNFNSTNGDIFNVALVPGTNDSKYTILLGSTVFSGLSIGELVTIDMPSSAPNSGTFIVTGVSSNILQVTNPNAVATGAEMVTAGVTFQASTGVMEGDTVVVAGPFSGPNQGSYRVIRTFNDSFWIQNADALEEEVVLSSGSLTFYEYEDTVVGDDLVISGTAFDGQQYTFTVTTASATEGATYTNNSQTFVVTNTIAGANTLVTAGTGTPTNTGTLTKTSGTGDATITFTAFTSSIGTSNAGTYPVTQLIDENNIIVKGVLTAASTVNLTGLLSSFYIEEGVPYSGYKHTYLVAPQPGSPALNEILFDTVAQYEKINQAAGVVVTSLDKLNFPTTVSQGLDGYKYNTGLIQEANRILYGDPTDPLTFPGVVAAGTDVFVREPLALVVNLALEVRLQTGAPFSSISQQVRNNVAALISSNPVGQSIAISNIIAVCTTIPGVISVAISSPLYNENNDLIVVQPSEQTFILDPSQNISVSLIT